MNKIKARFLPLLVLAMLVNILAQTVHETGHYLVYQVMGHEPVWAFTKLVQLSETTPTNPDEWIEMVNPDATTNWLKLISPVTGKMEKVIAPAAGPLAGLFSAVLGLVMSRRNEKTAQKQIWLAFTITSSLVAVLYYMRSPIRTGGDEYEIAMQLGLTISMIEISLGLAFITCLILGLRELPSWRIRLTWLGTILLGGIATGLLMSLADPLIIAKVDAGNPWFRPIFGFSLPVFLVIMLTFLGLWGWARWEHRESM